MRESVVTNNEKRELTVDELKDVSELSLDELESVSGGAQYPTSHPDGVNP